MRKDLLGIACPLAHYGHLICRSVISKNSSEPIQNTPAGRGDQLHADPVFFCHRTKSVGLIDLHRVHPQTERAYDRQLGGAQNHTAARQPRRCLRVYMRFGHDMPHAVARAARRAAMLR